MDFFNGRHAWRKLHDLLRRLSSRSRYVEAMVNDPDVAEAVIADEAARRKDAAAAAAEPSGPRLSEYSAEAERLDLLIELVQALNSNTIAAGTGKPGPKVNRQPRPTTAIDAARDRVRVRRHDELLDEVEQARARRRDPSTTP